MQKPSPGNKACNGSEKSWRRKMRSEAQRGVKFHKRELESVVRHTDSVPNGNAYRKLPIGVKGTYTLS